jgi:hypothetical protein
MGKTKEERYKIKDPDAPMSDNQSYALYSMTGVDVRGITDMTKGQASELIDAAKNGGAKKVRLGLSQIEGALVKTRDVHKNMRAEKSPVGYKGIKLPAAKPAKKAKVDKEAEADAEFSEDDIGLTMDALKKMAAKDPAQLIALLSGEALPEPKAKNKTAAKAKAQKEEPEAVDDKVAAALKTLATTLEEAAA